MSKKTILFHGLSGYENLFYISLEIPLSSLYAGHKQRILVKNTAVFRFHPNSAYVWVFANTKSDMLPI